MSLTIGEESDDFKLVDAGTHTAICTLICDMGRQETAYGVKRQVFVQWELPGQILNWRDDTGKERSVPMRLGKTYTLSLKPKTTLRKDVETWRGKAFTEEERKTFSVSAMLGAPCLLSVTHTESLEGRVRANVSAVMQLPTDIKVPEPKAVLLAYEVEEDDPEKFHALPPWLQEKVKARIEEKKEAPIPPPPPPPPPGTANGGNEFDDEIPF